MGVVGWSMLVVHLVLFIYLRKRYIGKKNIAEKKAAELNAENINLKSRVKSLEEMFG